MKSMITQYMVTSDTENQGIEKLHKSIDSNCNISDFFTLLLMVEKKFKFATWRASTSKILIINRSTMTFNLELYKQDASQHRYSFFVTSSCTLALIINIHATYLFPRNKYLICGCFKSTQQNHILNTFLHLFSLHLFVLNNINFEIINTFTQGRNVNVQQYFLTDFFPFYSTRFCIKHNDVFSLHIFLRYKYDNGTH